MSGRALTGWTVVAHNAPFEKGFLPELLGPIRAPVLDSCELLHYLYPELASHSLEAMLRWASDEHHAVPLPPEHPREDDRNDEIEGTPIPDPEEEQGDAEDVPSAD